MSSTVYDDNYPNIQIPSMVRAMHLVCLCYEAFKEAMMLFKCRFKCVKNVTIIKWQRETVTAISKITTPAGAFLSTLHLNLGVLTIMRPDVLSIIYQKFVQGRHFVRDIFDTKCRLGGIVYLQTCFRTFLSSVAIFLLTYVFQCVTLYLS